MREEVADIGTVIVRIPIADGSRDFPHRVRDSAPPYPPEAVLRVQKSIDSRIPLENTEDCPLNDPVSNRRHHDWARALVPPLDRTACLRLKTEALFAELTRHLGKLTRGSQLKAVNRASRRSTRRGRVGVGPDVPPSGIQLA
jgi:hypothetical protein